MAADQSRDHGIIVTLLPTTTTAAAPGFPPVVRGFDEENDDRDENDGDGCDGLPVHEVDLG
jgi:hypothetical protein